MPSLEVGLRVSHDAGPPGIDIKIRSHPVRGANWARTPTKVPSAQPRSQRHSRGDRPAFLSPGNSRGSIGSMGAFVRSGHLPSTPRPGGSGKRITDATPSTAESW